MCYFCTPDGEIRWLFWPTVTTLPSPGADLINRTSPLVILGQFHSPAAGGNSVRKTARLHRTPPWCAETATSPAAVQKQNACCSGLYGPATSATQPKEGWSSPGMSVRWGQTQGPRCENALGLANWLWVVPFPLPLTQAVTLLQGSWCFPSSGSFADVEKVFCAATSQWIMDQPQLLILLQLRWKDGKKAETIFLPSVS